ncbi:hypothetical protein FBU30_003154 [Linnemannia zychae]|nr:hypothetical protein FBU30_003154 [Linnemannia zychae]
MPKKKNPYLSPEEIVALLSPQSQIPPLFSKQSQRVTTYALSNTLIVDLIFEFLSPKDISACLRVCKTWNILGQTHYWRSIAFYYPYVHTTDGCSGHSRHEPREWKERRKPYHRDPVKTIDISIDSGVDWYYYFNELTYLHSYDRYEVPYIWNHMKEMIDRNASRVKSLKMDYSGCELLDLSFDNLTRLWLNCRFNSLTNLSMDYYEKRGERLWFNEVALEFLTRCPKLEDVTVMYTEVINYRQPKPRFALLILEALQRSQSSPTHSNLRSLSLFCKGRQSLIDLCDIIEKCPSSLQELTLQTLYNDYSIGDQIDEVALQHKLTSIKNKNIITDPALRRLNISWYKVYGVYIPDYSETFLYPLLSCFPDLQDVRIPLLSASNWDLDIFSETLSPRDHISIIMASCPSITTIDFGDNLMSEEQMLQILKTIPQEQKLKRLTMKISHDYIPRVVPLLLERWSSSLQELCLSEVGFNRHPEVRSTYIADILATCPQLKSLSVDSMPWMRYSTKEAYIYISNIGLDDLLGVKWVCTNLETLSIAITSLTGKAAESVDKEADCYQSLFKWTTADPQLLHYNRKIDNLIKFYQRLKSLPRLVNPDLDWDWHCQKIVYDPFDHNNDFQDKLRWMGLKWSIVHNLKAMTVEDTVKRVNTMDDDETFQCMLQEKGIKVTDGYYRLSCPCPWLPRTRKYQWPSDYDQVSMFEDVSDAYKSRGTRRHHMDFFKRNK